MPMIANEANAKIFFISGYWREDGRNSNQYVFIYPSIKKENKMFLLGAQSDRDKCNIIVLYCNNV